jgi:hypothetical protein
MLERVRAARWLAWGIAVSAVVGLVGPAKAQRAPATSAGALATEGSNARPDRASCVLMLRSGPRYTGIGYASGSASGLADLSALTTAMTTTGLIDPAAKAALGLRPRAWPKVVRIDVTSAGAQAVKLSVTVDPGPDALKQPDPAAALMHALIDRAKTVVSQQVEPRRREVKDRLDELEKRRAEHRASLDALRKRLREAEARGFNTMTGVPDPTVSQRRQVEAELAAKRPRLQAIKEILPRYAAQVDDVGAALRGLVAAREALVAGLEKALEHGKSDPLELLRARAELAEAKVRAAEGGPSPSVTSARTIRDEQMTLELDIASLEAQLRALPAPRPEAVKPPAEDVQQLRSELFRLENEGRTLETQYQQVLREYEQLASPPTLVVLDGQQE